MAGCEDVVGALRLRKNLFCFRYVPTENHGVRWAHVFPLGVFSVGEFITGAFLS